MPNCFSRVVTTALLVLAASNALADFIPNYSAWKDMPDNVRHGYVMGIYDRSTKVWSSDPTEKALVFGISRCAKDLKIDSTMIVNAINKHYLNDTTTWSKGGFEAFHDTIARGACLDHINQERSLLNLDQWKVNR